uniref:Uncharacterized protein n=1 Tax=Oryza glumipatula TaxID=40148 RepID=A0A0E0BCI2_9ORYZ
MARSRGGSFPLDLSGHGLRGHAVAAAQGGGGVKPDRSIAGADVILVGFAAAVVVVVFWYIRITRKSSSGGGGGVEAARKLEILKEQPAVVVEVAA